MARRTPAPAGKPERKPSAQKAGKAGKSKKNAPSADGGSTMIKLLFYLAVLGGVGYAAMRIPLGGKTAAEHLREVVRWDQVADKGAEVGRELGKSAKDALAKQLGDKPAEKGEKPADKASAKKPAEKPAKVASRASERAPAEKISRDDRAALDRLVR